MSPSLRARVLLALGATPALLLGACLPTQQLGAGDDDDEEEGSEQGGGGNGAGSGWGAAIDHDGDGYPTGEDCNDSDASISPGAVEWCNGIDDDCDLDVDEDLEQYAVYPDADADGYGTEVGALTACAAPEGYVWQAGDCDDNDATAHPGAPEICDGADQDCDGQVDRVDAWVDADGDGWAGTWSDRDVCDELPEGVSETRDDCNDADPEISPDAVEVCGNGIDDDCDGAASCIVYEVGPVGETEAQCRYAWQAPYLETWAEPCEGCSFPAYGSWMPTDEWLDSSACANPYEQWMELYVSGEVVADPWGGSHPILESSSARLAFGSTQVQGDATPVWIRIEGELMLAEIGYVGAGGRPFTVDGSARVAEPGRSAGWSLPADPRSPPAALRSRLASAWAEAGRMEHASVASFARFTLELMALGAPAELLAGASAAMADEIDHAQRCFGLAAALGAPPTVGPLPVHGALDGAGDATRTLVSLLAEGCIGETLAAAEADAARARCQDPAARGVLAVIAEDEARHAALSWRAARWLLARHPGLRTAAAQVFEAARPTGPLPPPDGDAAALAAHGVLSERDRARSAREAWRTVLGPARDLLLATSPELHA